MTQTPPKGAVLPFPSVSHGTACQHLSEQITEVIEKVIADNPGMLAVSVLGVLRVVETNFIARMP